MKIIQQNALLLLFFIPCLNVLGQPIFFSGTPAEKRMPHRADLTMDSSAYASITEARGVKIEVPAREFRFKEQVYDAKEIKIRGNSALNFRRKSFTVKLEDRQAIMMGDTTKQLKKFFLISMSMDAHYFHNRFAFLCLDELNLFNVQNSYTELFINGQSEGLYLIMERPEDYIMRDLDAQFLMRRTYGGRMDEYEVADNIKRWQADEYVQRYGLIIQQAMRLKNKQLERFLEKKIDLSAYLRWMAFNYWVRNGDYTDEVFFYALNYKDPMHIVAWDYDDIFATKPHEGNIRRDERIGDRLIFSSEAYLDRIIAQDDVLYERYLQELRFILHHFTAEKVSSIMDRVYSELYPYFQKGDIMEASLNDKNAGTSLDALQGAMETTYREHLIARRAEVLAKID